MSDNLETTQTDPSGEIETETSTETVSLEDLQKQVKQLQNDNESWKGRFKKIEQEKATLAKEKKELETKGLSEADKEKAEAKAEKEFYVNKTRDALIKDLELTEETASLISGETGEEIEIKATVLKKYKETLLAEKDKELASLRKEIETLKGNMPNPGGGTANINMGIDDRIAEAKKAGNLTLAAKLLIEKQRTKN